MQPGVLKDGESVWPGYRLDSCHIDLWHHCWHNYLTMRSAKKITIHVPEDLLQKAQKSTGQGITETVRRGLQLVAASESYEALRRLRGKVKFSVSLKNLREDRR